jgi:hypothetical protein
MLRFKQTTFRTILLASVVGSSASSVCAMQLDAATVFKDELEQVEEVATSPSNCKQLLRQGWGSFSGHSREYQALEEKYINGAANATLCAVRRGVVLALALDYVQQVVRAGGIKRLGKDGVIKEAKRLLSTTPLSKIDTFSQTVMCHSTTPVFQMGWTFTQTVNISCSSEKGPLHVNLNTMHVQVGGQDIWNGASQSHFGRSLSSALMSK